MVAVTRYLVTLLLVATSAVANGQLSTRLSSDTVEELESVRLAIRDHGARQSEALDLAALQNDFHIMGNNTSNQYQSINGRTRSWVDYQITLQPKRTGSLIIPPIRVGTQFTEELVLTVTPLAASTRQQIDELVFYEQEFSAAEAYVQSQILMQRRLYYSNGVQLYGGQPSAPEVRNAIVITLGENRASTEQRNGRNYGVVIQNYAIFPEASGTLTIPGVEMTASVRVLNSGRVSRKGVRVGTEPVSILVRPVPDSYPANAPWLPATNVTITQTLDRDITKSPVTVGDTLSQTIRVTVTSNTGSIVPPLDLPISAQQFREYPEPPQIDDNTLGKEVIGWRIERRNLIALTPGTLTLPGSKIVWWDTAADQLRTTVLDDIRINSEGQPLQQPSNSSNLSNNAQGAALPEGRNKNSIKAAPNQTVNSAPTFSQTLKPWLSANAISTFALLGVATLIVYLSWKHMMSPRQRQQRALRSCRREILSHLRNNDEQRAQDALADYLKLRYGLMHKPARTAWIAEQPRAVELLQTLDQWSYDQNQSHQTRDLNALLTLASEILDTKIATPNNKKRSASLPALYPS